MPVGVLWNPIMRLTDYMAPRGFCFSYSDQMAFLRPQTTNERNEDPRFFMIKKEIKNKYNLLSGEFIRFAIVGIIATSIHYGIYYGLQLIINVNIAYTIGYIISWICNFFLSVHFTFKTTANVKKGFGFAVSHGINYLLHMAFLNLFLRIGLSNEIAPILVYCCVIPINFILVRTVFKSKWFQS